MNRFEGICTDLIRDYERLITIANFPGKRDACHGERQQLVKSVRRHMEVISEEFKDRVVDLKWVNPAAEEGKASK